MVKKRHHHRQQKSQAVTKEKTRNLQFYAKGWRPGVAFNAGQARGSRSESNENTDRARAQ